MKYKIRYQDTMTTYLLDETFNTEKEAENFINLNLGEGSCYEVELKENDNEPTKKIHIDFECVTNFLEEYDYWGGDGWVTEILNGNIDLELMRKAVISHSVGNRAEGQQSVDDMFIKKWWENNNE